MGLHGLGLRFQASGLGCYAFCVSVTVYSHRSSNVLRSPLESSNDVLYLKSPVNLACSEGWYRIDPSNGSQLNDGSKADA